MSDENFTYVPAGAEPISFGLDYYGPKSLTFMLSGKMAMTFWMDGRIEIGEGLTPDEAGKAAINAMQHQLHFIIAAAYEDAAKIAEFMQPISSDRPVNGNDIASVIRARAKEKTT